MNVSNLKAPAVVPVTPHISLANVKRGRLDVPIKMLGYGTDGVGKSSFAAGAPSPFFVTLDNRTAHLDIARADPAPKSFADMLGWIRLIELEKHDFKTLVLDPVNWGEPLVAVEVTGDPKMTLEKWDGGFGRGISAATDRWREVISCLERVWMKGIHVIVLAHCTTKRFDDPEGASYDRYEIAMNPKSAGLFRQWADYVLFMRREAVARKIDSSQKFRGQATGRHVAHTKWTAAYDAKFSGTAPDEIPLEWDAFYTAVQSSRKAGDEIRGRIDELCKQINIDGVTTRVRADVKMAGENHDRLEQIANALVVKLNEIQEGQAK